MGFRRRERDLLIATEYSQLSSQISSVAARLACVAIDLGTRP